MLQPSPLKLQTFTGEVIIPKGEYGGQTCRLPLLVTPGKRPVLLGCYWLSDLHLNWKELVQQHQLHQVTGDAASMNDQCPSLFREDLGDLKGSRGDGAKRCTYFSTNSIWCRTTCRANWMLSIGTYRILTSWSQCTILGGHHLQFPF